MKVEFSKFILSAIICTYFIGVSVGTYVVANLDPTQIQWYFAFIGGPTATAIAFYAWKAKSENVLKIQKPTEFPDDMSDYEQEDNR